MAVTSTNNLRQGSSGDDVRELQRLLNSTGNYNLAEDGIFGNQTLSAVKDYQQKNSLTVDGIVGTQTWGALTGSQGGSADNTEATDTTPAETKPSFEYKPYTPSDTVAQAEALLQQQLANKPGEYNSTWQAQVNDILNKIMNREDFSYDLNGDALYQQLKDQYTMLGKMASMDTMGQAAAMTGGYGNSYAQGVGQQAYQAYLQQLNEQVPELYQLARDQHNRETDELYNQASLTASMEDQEYGRYRDQLSDYYTELDRLTNDSRYQAEQDYSKWADDQSFGYQQYRDQISDQQWQSQFDEAKRQYDEQMALSQNKSSSSTGGTNYTGGGSYDAEAAKKQQELVNAGYNVAVDGIWGPESKAAWEEYQATSKNDQPKKTSSTGFTGSTYEEAVAFMKNNGVSESNAVGVMTREEWFRRKSSYELYGTGGAEVMYNDTYKEYLQSYVDYKINSNG